MNVSTLFDPIFLVPFFNGLLLALLLPIVGAYARLRGELLASLGVTQMAAAGVGLGAFLGANVMLGALLAAGVAASMKAIAGRQGGNDAYAVMLLAGWGAGLLLAANTTRGDELARALLQGQIYFTRGVHLQTIGAVVALAGLVMPWLSPRLLLGCFFPDYYLANGITTPRHDLVFDILLATTLALSAIVVGVMGAFALVILPPWVSFRFAQSWRSTLALAALVGTVSYTAAFGVAILFDQPFGPVLVVLLLVASLGRLLPVR